jgi:two-component system, NtrC family, response regulator GlrR
MAMFRCAILAIGAPPGLVASVASGAHGPGFDVCPCDSIDAVGDGFDAVVLVGATGASHRLRDAIIRLRQDRPGHAILVAGAGFDAEQLGEVFAAGAHDFVGAPVCEGELNVRLRRALGLIGAELPLPMREAMGVHLRDFIGHSPAFMKQIAKLPTFAGCDAGVLIQGETGTGKELCAQAIHYLSARASRAWIAVNCGAIPIELIESELFGHVRGAYTTAHTAREGLVTQAEGGTLFLDDIDCLPNSAQAKLLRFLQEREYRTLGANAVRRADVRVIAASNHDLAMLCARGEFRRDLYFRLNILTLRLPPLRERREDIPELTRHLIARLARKLARPAPSLSPPALRRLLAHEWPGNVRELEHVIERSLVLGRGATIGAQDIDIGGTSEETGAGESFQSAKDRVVERFERAYIEQLLMTFEGNITHAAQGAKKNRRAFFELMRKHGIEPQRFRSGHR